MNDRFSWTPLRDVTAPVERPETPVSGTMYRQLGVRLWGEGAYERETIDGAQTRYATLSRVAEDDIVVNKIWARNGSVAVVPNSLDGCYVSGEFPTFVVDSAKLLPRWFHWLTKTRDFWMQCDEKSRGTSGKNRIRPEQFLAVTIPLPSLDEQRRIVARIEELAGRIEEAQGLRREAGKLLQTLMSRARAVVFEALAQRGTVPLESAAVLQRGRFSYRPRNEPRFFGGDHPWIQIAEIQAADKHITKWTQTLNDEGLAISRKFPKGTILVSIAATIGAVAILDFDCCIPDSIVAVTPRLGYDSEYLYHFLGYVQSRLEYLAPQSAQKNVNLRILAPLPVPAVDLKEQRRMVNYIEGVQAKAGKIERVQGETAAQLDALLPSILDRAFSGELVEPCCSAGMESSFG